MAADKSPAAASSAAPEATPAFLTEQFEFKPPTVEGLNPDMADPPSFYDWKQTFPFLEELVANQAAIAEEAKKTKWWYDWPEKNLYGGDGKMDWKVLPLVHTFPGNDPSKTTWIDAHCDDCPTIAGILKKVPGLRIALLSRLGPNTVLSAHQGWAILANHVLRCHLPLEVPQLDGEPAFVPGTALSHGEEKATLNKLSPPPGACGLVVDNQLHYHREGGLMVFDDSHPHYAFNKHPSKNRLVLIFDIARPDGFPHGHALGGTTEQLEGFIKYFS